MEYGKIIGTGFKQAWKYKSLWIFGFLLSLGESGGNFNFDLLKRHNSDFLNRLGFGSFGEFDIARWISDHVALIALIALGFLFIFVIFVILSRIAAGGLIDAAGRFKKNLTYTFGTSFGIGVKFFWPMLGLWLLNAIVAAALVIFLILFGVVAFLIHAVVGVLSLLILIPILIIGIFLMVTTVSLTERYIVLEQMPVFDALGEAWSLWIKQAGNTIIYALLYLGVSIGIFIGFAIITGVVAMPFIAIFLINKLIALLLGLPVLLLVWLVFGGFTSSAMKLMTTEFYFQLRDDAKPQPAVATPPPDIHPSPSSGV